MLIANSDQIKRLNMEAYMNDTRLGKSKRKVEIKSTSGFKFLDSNAHQEKITQVFTSFGLSWLGPSWQPSLGQPSWLGPSWRPSLGQPSLEQPSWLGQLSFEQLSWL